MKLKDGVSLAGLRREIHHAFRAIDRAHYDLTGEPATITSTTEGKHSVKRSAHYRGDAVDVRIWNLDGQQFRDQIAEQLGDDYVVLLESDHIHLHWGPIYAGE